MDLPSKTPLTVIALKRKVISYLNIIMIKHITFVINTYLLIKVFIYLLGLLCNEQNHTTIRSGENNNQLPMRHIK